MNDRPPCLGHVDRVCLAMGADTGMDHHLQNAHVLRLPGAPPGLELLRQHVAERATHLPALTLRRPEAGSHRWTASPPLNPADHVRALTLPPGDVTTLEQALLDRGLLDGALWSLSLVDGYAEDEYALCYRSHHAFQDARSGTHTLRVLFGADPNRASDSSPVRFRPVRGLRPAALTAVVADIAVSLLAVRHPPAGLGGGGSHPGDGSGWGPGLDGRRRVGGVSVDGARIHAVARRTQVSVNDVYLALVAAALTEHAGPAQRHACVPLDLRVRGEDDGGLGNCLGMTRVKLPADNPEPATIHGATRRARSPAYRTAMRTVSDLAPGPVGRWATRHLVDPRRSQLVASNVTYPHPLGFAGAMAHDAFVLSALLPGHGCVSTISTFGRTIRVGFITGPGAPDPQRLADAWFEALQHLEGETRAPSSPLPT